MTAEDFSVVAGGVTGRDHLHTRRDGQDGLALVTTSAVRAAIVTDGCSSGARTEIGARLGASWLAILVAETFARDPDPERAAALVTTALVGRIEATARSLSPVGEIDPDVLADTLLFGFLAAVVASERVIVFGVGDGLVWVDGERTIVDAGPDNAPPYPAYALLGRPTEPSVHHLGRAGALDVVAVATDGARELADDGDALDALVREARSFVNPSLLRKRLIVLSDRGRLHDDTTIGIVRRDR